MEAERKIGKKIEYRGRGREGQREREKLEGERESEEDRNTLKHDGQGA